MMGLMATECETREGRPLNGNAMVQAIRIPETEECRCAKRAEEEEDIALAARPSAREILLQRKETRSLQAISD